MPRFKKRDRALEIHEQYYGSSKGVIDPWKNHNIVRGYRCSVRNDGKSVHRHDEDAASPSVMLTRRCTSEIVIFSGRQLQNRS
jgi:hypothetical protein